MELWKKLKKEDKSILRYNGVNFGYQYEYNTDFFIPKNVLAWNEELPKIKDKATLTAIKELHAKLIWKSTKFELSKEDVEMLEEIRYINELHKEKLYKIEKELKLKKKSEEDFLNSKLNTHDWIFNEEQTEKYCNNGCDNHKVHKIELQNQ